VPALNPEQFLQRVGKGPLAPAYLFAGPEGYYRRLCKAALIERHLMPEMREQGYSQFDLESSSLAEVLDDARSLSLFAQDRIIWTTSAELALPRRLTASEDGDGERGSEALVADYLKTPSAGTVIVFECSRYDFSGDDRTKMDRVLKFYSAVPVTVEFRSLTPESSRFLAQQMAKERGLRLAGADLALLLESIAGDANRLASEMDKLALYVGSDGAITREDLRNLVPHTAQSTIFSLVNALGRRDRAQALHSLDVLIREGEYLPLALTFLSTQFRLALVAQEAKLTNAQQAQSYFGKIGVRMWRDRAEQLLGTAQAFSRKHLMSGIALLYETDKRFRDGYRDDRVVMETLIFALTAKP
jgi:DNA polymerase III subunit delta